MNLYWKIVCWVILLGNIIGIIYSLTNKGTAFEVIWMILTLAVVIKALELGKEIEISKK
jgi:hypothetical protein